VETTTMTMHNGIEAELGQREIERMVERGGRFLRAVGTRPAIMRDLLAVGYDLEEHHAGWGLFLALCGYDLGAPAEVSRPEAQAAMEQLDSWDGPAFARARAALGRHFPEQAAHIFAGLDAQSGVASVAACKRFLDRVQELREGSDPARAATREADRQAVARLEQRRALTPEIEQRLRALLAQAMQLTELPAVDVAREREVQSAAQRFKAWLEDWRATAAATIARRDHLISLGLATRRSSSGEVEDESAAPEVSVASDAMVD
jgi:hypothetical protein